MERISKSFYTKDHTGNKFQLSNADINSATLIVHLSQKAETDVEAYLKKERKMSNH